MTPWILPCFNLDIPDAPGFHFPKNPTIGIYFFEVVTLVFALAVAVYAWRKLPRGLWRFTFLCIGIFFFEFFTSPMWNNWNMSCWAYVYQDISWVLTLGWASVFLVVMTLVDRYTAGLSELKRFFLYLPALAFVVFFLEIWVVNIGIRSYAPEVEQTLLGIKIFGVPLELFYYVPVFAALVISFYRSWMLIIEDYPIPPFRHLPWGKTLASAFIAIFLFELMVEPMVTNVGLPGWSYIYNDISPADDRHLGAAPLVGVSGSPQIPPSLGNCKSLFRLSLSCWRIGLAR